MANLLQGLGNLGQMDTNTMIGYKLGQYISNYIDRGKGRDATNTILDAQTNDKIAQNTANNAATGQNLANSMKSFEALNPSLSSGGDQNAVSATTQGTSNEPTFNTSANILDAVNSNGTFKTAQDSPAGLLSGIGTNTQQTAEKMAQQGQVPTNNNNPIQAIQAQQTSNATQAAVSALADEKAKQEQQLSLIAKYASFNPAASASQAGAASSRQGSKNTPVNVTGTNVAGTVDPSNIDTAVKQAVSQTLSPDSNGLLGASANALNLVTSQPQAQQQLTPAQQLATSKIQGDIIRTKAAYQQAQAKNDVAGMQQAHDMANMIRYTAQKMGLSNAVLGADSTLQDALSKKNEDDYNQQIRQIVNPDQSTQEYYNQTYNKLRDLGYGYDVANRVASQQAQSYQAKRISTLSSQLALQGLAPTGAVNNLGAQVLTKLLNESPQAYEALSKMYAMPVDDYKFNNSIKQAVTEEGLRKDLAGFDSGLHMKEADHNMVNTMQVNNQVLDNQKNLKQFEAGISVQQKAALDQIALKTQGIGAQQKYGIMYNAAKQFGMDDEMAGKYALGLLGKGTQEKVSKSDQKTMNNFEYLYEQAIAPDSNGTLSGSAVDILVDAVNKDVGKYDDDTRDYLNSMVLAAEGLREKAAGHEDMAASYWSGIPDYLKHKLLPNYYGNGE